MRSNIIRSVLLIAVLFANDAWGDQFVPQKPGLALEVDVYGKSSNVEKMPWSDSASTSVRAGVSEGWSGLSIWSEKIYVSSSSMSPKSNNFGKQMLYGVDLARTSAAGNLTFDVGLSRRMVKEPLSLTRGYPPDMRFPVDMNLNQRTAGSGIKLMDYDERGDLWLIARYESFSPVEQDSNLHNPLRPYFQYMPEYALPELKSWDRVSVGLASEHTLLKDLMLNSRLEYAKTGEFYGLIGESSAVQVRLRCSYGISGYLVAWIEGIGTYQTDNADGALKRSTGSIVLGLTLRAPPYRPW